MKTTVNYQGLVNAKLLPKHLILSNRNILDQKALSIALMNIFPMLYRN